jgi:RNA polymerase sigma-70 factor, ECF subfamily
MAMSRASTARATVDLTFEELYRGHHDDVYRAALRELGNAHDAEDVTQTAFADAYRAVLRGTRPEAPRAWLLAICENVRRRRFRTAQRRPREELVDDADFPLAAELPYEQSQALAEALAALPPEQRRVFVLREIVGLSYAEIAEDVDSTVASIQMLLFRARRSLRDELEPPTVARRPLFMPPLPGWLVGMWSRIEVATLTPRAAGALGATVLTVAGASVAVPAPQADARDLAPATAESGVAATAKPAAARVVAKAKGRVTTKPTAGARTTGVRTIGRTTPKARPAQQQPGATAPPTSTPIGVPGTAPVSAPVEVAETPRATPAIEPPRVAVTLVDEVVEAPTVELPLPPVSLPPLPVPVQVQVPTPAALPDPVEVATGAAGAAGASAPPVPVPAVPLPTLPRAP